MLYVASRGGNGFRQAGSPFVGALNSHFAGQLAFQGMRETAAGERHRRIAESLRKIIVPRRSRHPRVTRRKVLFVVRNVERLRARVSSRSAAPLSPPPFTPAGRFTRHDVALGSKIENVE